MRPFALALLTLLLARPCFALPPPTPVKAELLIKQLGSNDYYEREAASKALRALGKPALPALRVACDSKDAEVRKRARRLVEDLAPVQHASEPTIWLELDVKQNVFIMQQPNFIFLPVQKDVLILTTKQPAKP
jgi:hypothetical protein